MEVLIGGGRVPTEGLGLLGGKSAIESLAFKVTHAHDAGNDDH